MRDGRASPDFYVGVPASSPAAALIRALMPDAPAAAAYARVSQLISDAIKSVRFRELLLPAHLVSVAVSGSLKRGTALQGSSDLDVQLHLAMPASLQSTRFLATHVRELGWQLRDELTFAIIGEKGTSLPRAVQRAAIRGWPVSIQRCSVGLAPLNDSLGDRATIVGVPRSSNGECAPWLEQPGDAALLRALNIDLVPIVVGTLPQPTLLQRLAVLFPFFPLGDAARRSTSVVSLAEPTILLPPPAKRAAFDDPTSSLQRAMHTVTQRAAGLAVLWERLDATAGEDVLHSRALRMGVCLLKAWNGAMTCMFDFSPAVKRAQVTATGFAERLSPWKLSPSFIMELAVCSAAGEG